MTDNYVYKISYKSQTSLLEFQMYKFASLKVQGKFKYLMYLMYTFNWIWNEQKPTVETTIQVIIKYIEENKYKYHEWPQWDHHQNHLFVVFLPWDLRWLAAGWEGPLDRVGIIELVILNVSTHFWNSHLIKSELGYFQAFYFYCVWCR